jgi:hypothetical protein
MAFIIPAAMAAASAIGGAASAGIAAAGGAASALSLGATALSVVGTGVQAEAQARAANYNAQVSQLQGQQAQEQGALRASEVIRRTNQEQAAARAGALQSGFALTGSVSDLLQQSERAGYLDALTAVYDGRVAATSAANDAALSRSSARNARTAGVIGMGAQALTGVSSFYGRKTRQIGVG